MEIILNKLNGFCAGSSNTIKQANDILDKYDDNIYCLGEILHNERVISSLEDKGMITINSIDEVPDGAKLIFRAHGETKENYLKVKNKNIMLFDFTCPKVKKIHDKVESNSKDSFVIIIGKKTHPEVVGTKSFAGDNSYVIENENDIDDCFDKVIESNLNSIYICSQTTYSSEKFNEITDFIQSKYDNYTYIIDNTTCPATKNRQDETSRLSDTVNAMIVIGGKHSSNTLELANIAREKLEKVFLVQDISDLEDIDLSNINKLGISSGASTPDEVTNEIIDYINDTYN
jgi:4-hydroxy-3-methylbut-2-enyl diphosphate reductase